MRSTYKIKRGDTLGAIARRLGTTVKKLAELNGIKDPNKIRAGASLKLPVAAKQKWMAIQKKESGATLSQKPFEAASAKQKAAGGTGGVVSNKARKGPKKAVSTPTPPPPRPKKSKKNERTVSATVNPNTGRTVDKTVTYSQHLKNIDKAIANGVLSSEAQFNRQKRSLAQANVDKLLKKAVKAKEMNKGGAALKPVPAGNKGLKKLPTAVRNRMGFMRKGGVAKKK